MKYSTKLFLITIASLFIVLQTSLVSSTVEVPVLNQLKFLQKILLTEKQLSVSKEKEIEVGIIYQSDNRNSRKTFEDIMFHSGSTPVKVGDKTLKFIPIDLKNSKDIANIISNKNNNIVIFIITQLRNFDYRQIKKYALDNSILTYTTNADIMENYNFSLSVTYINNTMRPLINTSEVKSEGYNFPASIFQFAKPTK